MIEMVTDLRDLRLRKQAELEFYAGQLRVLELRMSVLRAEVDLTSHIIDIIEHEIPTRPVRARI